MPTGKLKSLAIFILLAANLALAVLTIYRQGTAAQYEQSALRQIVGILEDNGISVEADLPNTLHAQPMLAQRDDAALDRLLFQLLGDASIEASGAASYYYSDAGEAYRRANSEYEISFSERLLDGSEPLSYAQELLSSLSLNATLLHEEQADGRTSLIYQQTANGVAVLDYDIVFLFDGERLLEMRGRQLPGGFQLSEFDGPLLDMATILTRFYAVVRSGYVCSRITQLDYCYHSLDGSSFTPLWRLQTDTGTLYFDPVTGNQS